MLSTALLFLIAGAALGPGGFGVDAIQPTNHIVTVLADLALFTVLFTDGQRASLPALRATWRLSRALGLGMPSNHRGFGIALPGHYLLRVGLDYGAADRRDPVPQRLPIVSFRIRSGAGRYLHHNFVVAVLNDLFGIQPAAAARAPALYGHRLLTIDAQHSRAYRDEIG